MGTYALRISRRLIVLAAVALLPLACAPKAVENDPAAIGADLRENALVRFVNATTIQEPVDLYVDETRTFPKVGKDKVTDYNEWLAERHDIDLRTAGHSMPVASNSERLSSGQRYTVVGYSKIDGTSALAVFRDHGSQPERGKAWIRLIHVAAGTDKLEIFPAGSQDSIVSGVDYKTDMYAQVDPGVKLLEIRQDDKNTGSVRVPELALEAGKTYTIVLAVDKGHKFRAIPIENTTPIREGHLRQ